MKFQSFRQIFTLILTASLCVLGVYLGSTLHFITDNPPAWLSIIPSQKNYLLGVQVGLGAIGALLGISLGPRIADVIILTGKSLEAMSAVDKIAVGSGITLGVIVMLLFSKVLDFIPALPIRITVYAVLGVILVYLGIVSMLSMKTELVAILSRGGGQSVPAEATEANPTENCKILDTNVIIDGRIADICRTGFVEGTLYVPGFVLEELQHIADSGDGLKRARGRRGLDILNVMQKELTLTVRVWDKLLDKSVPNEEVDAKLVRLAKVLDGVIVTNDFNLNKVAALQGVQVLNVNELANAVKPVVLPGEAMIAAIVKEGKESNQGVAYLDDGTMIVVEDGRRFIGTTLSVIVTSVLQTVAGKMIFARLRNEDEGDGFDYNAHREARNNAANNGHGVETNSSGYSRSRQSKKIR